MFCTFILILMCDQEVGSFVTSFTKTANAVRAQEKGADVAGAVCCQWSVWKVCYRRHDRHWRRLL